MKKLMLLSVAVGCGFAQAQSYQFSQFFSTPLLTNPANTGYMDGPFRVGSNFRSQGLQGSTAYFTGYVGGDVSPLQQRLTQGHKAGVGMYVMSDQSLAGAFQTNTVALSTAYHVGLDQYGEQSIGVGLQGSYNQRRLDYTKLTFENQYGPTGYNPGASPGENFNTQTRNFFDVNAGVVYNLQAEDRALFVGASVYNILRHKEQVLPDEFRVATRLMVQAGGQLFVGEYGKVYASLTHMNQSKASQTTVGAAYGLQLGDVEKNELSLGMWYRIKDAFIPYLGYQRKGFGMGLSYDYTASQLRSAAQVRNGYELTLTYRAPDNRRLKTLIPWY